MSTADNPTVADRILDLLRREGRPMSPAEIADALGGDKGYVRKEVVRLADNGTLTKPRRGLYDVPPGGQEGGPRLFRPRPYDDVEEPPREPEPCPVPSLLLHVYVNDRAEPIGGLRIQLVNLGGAPSETRASDLGGLVS